VRGEKPATVWTQTQCRLLNMRTVVRGAYVWTPFQCASSWVDLLGRFIELGVAVLLAQNRRSEIGLLVQEDRSRSSRQEAGGSCSCSCLLLLPT